MKTYLYLRRCRKFALGGYGMLILKKAFKSMREHALKQAMLKNASRQVVRLRKKHALANWVAEFDRKTREEGAAYVVQFATAHQILTAWRNYTADEKAIKTFRKERTQRRLKAMTIRGFQQNTVVT